MSLINQEIRVGPYGEEMPMWLKRKVDPKFDARFRKLDKDINQAVLGGGVSMLGALGTALSGSLSGGMLAPIGALIPRTAEAPTEPSGPVLTNEQMQILAQSRQQSSPQHGSPLMGQGTGEMPASGKLNAPSISEAEELLPYLLAGGAYRAPLRFPAWTKRIVKGRRGSRGKTKRGYPGRKAAADKRKEKGRVATEARREDALRARDEYWERQERIWMDELDPPFDFKIGDFPDHLYPY